MNTQKAVYNRLFAEAKKTELESQKVELSISDDVQDILSKSENSLKEARKLISTNKKFLDTYKKSLAELGKIEKTLMSKDDELMKLSDTAARIVMKAEELADDLGVNANSIKGLSKLDKISRTLIEVAGEVQEAYTSID